MDDLPLRYRTPAPWAAEALRNPLALLSDHAYLERKAASNALELLNRWPEPKHPVEWAPTLAAIARDETQHLQIVLGVLARKGGALQRLHQSGYAAALRLLVRKGDGPREILDRLLVSALIEARSCERFGLLMEASSDQDLRDLYGRLWSSELGHFKQFLRLGSTFVDGPEVEQRWHELLKEEAVIAQRQPFGFTLHSGVNYAAERTP